MGYLAKFIHFPAVQKFWQLGKIWQSYREFEGGNFFETRCRWCVSCRLSYVVSLLPSRDSQRTSAVLLKKALHVLVCSLIQWTNCKLHCVHKKIYFHTRLNPSGLYVKCLISTPDPVTGT